MFLGYNAIVLAEGLQNDFIAKFSAIVAQNALWISIDMAALL